MTKTPKTKRRTITQHIRRARSKERLLELAEKWINDWEAEQTGLIDRLGNAVARDDYDEECICTGQLRAITEKRFNGLKNSAREIIGRIHDATADTETNQERPSCRENDPETGR